MDTPVYTVAVTVGGSSQTTESKIGNVLPQTIITRQSGSIVATFTDAAGAAFDLSSLTSLDMFAKPFNSSETPVNMGTGVISGAGNNIYTVVWVKDKIPAGWSTFAQDRDGAIVLYLQLEETGTLDFYQWGTRFNVDDGDYTGTADVLPLVSLVFYYNPIWGYNNTTVDADPGAGIFRMDATALASVTELYIADDNQSSVDMQTLIQSSAVGTNIYITNPNVATDAALFTVSGARVNNVGYTTIPVTFVDSGSSSFTNSAILSFSFIPVANEAPFIDSTALIKNAGDPTKLIGFDASAITTGTERTITMPDADVDLTLVGAAGAGIANTYTFDTTTTASDPGADGLRFNNATPASVTALYINDDANGVDISSLIDFLSPGDTLYIQETDTAANYILVTITSITDNTGWYTIVVTVDDSGTLPTNTGTVGIDFGRSSMSLDRQNIQTGTAYTGVIGDAGKTVTMNNAAANIFTIPTNASVAYPTNTVINILALGAGITSVLGDTGVTVNGVSAGSNDLAQFGGTSIIKTATNTWTLLVGASGSLSVAIYEDQKATTTNGGTNISGTQTRTLNTEVSDIENLGTLSANAVTLIAGTYIVEGRAPCYRGEEHKLFLYDGTSNIIIGTSQFSVNSTAANSTNSQILGVITADGIKAYSLRHYTKTIRATSGLGFDTADGSVEVYSQLKFTLIG